MIATGRGSVVHPPYDFIDACVSAESVRTVFTSHKLYVPLIY